MRVCYATVLFIGLALSSQAMMQQTGVTVAVGTMGGFAPAGPQGTTGAPYSAEQVSETVQTLADGTHISQSNVISKSFRDSEGRTRTEHMLPPPPGVKTATPRPAFITISDPVAGYTYNLNERTHTATRMAMPSPTNHWFDNRVMAVAPSAAKAGGDSQSTKLFTKTAAASPSETSDPTRPQTTREKLGTQVIEGVSAEGTRVTTTYPEGSVGNDRSFTTVSETWVSRELGTVVLSTNSDPRTGERTTKLINISRSEPDPALFQIPSDYTIEDQHKN